MIKVTKLKYSPSNKYKKEICAGYFGDCFYNEYPRSELYSIIIGNGYNVGRVCYGYNSYYRASKVHLYMCESCMNKLRNAVNDTDLLSINRHLELQSEYIKLRNQHDKLKAKLEALEDMIYGNH